GVGWVVDCSADHRHVPGWVYGQPEWAAASLGDARRIAAPGCFATALTLGLAPLVAAGIVRGTAMITAATGSTGSGAEPSQGTHHPLRAVNLRGYKVLAHQHEPEVKTFLASLGNAPELAFVPLSAPIDRGILASLLVPVGGDAVSAVARAYEGAPLVRIRKGSPELRHVRGTAFADLSVQQRGDVVSVLVAIDNLGKGAAAQAVQALNLSLGLPADLGLRVAAATP
ncbi:MAG: N-acetyl-gamma-glutamyl-phosphate reductase, partial [Myxococcales bacterium]|nr:N-acetyl-gamma-glutamyl-phosphate reductase [Myxococcales bacterium]